jgi:signal transduction histidine kinase
MRSTIEVEMADLSEGQVKATLGSVLQEVIALQWLVEDLLHLARSDAGQAVVRREAVDLDDLVLDEAQKVKSGGRIDVDVSAVSAALVHGDRIQLSRLVANLMDNAERHADGRIVMTLSEGGAWATLVVEDDGPGIPEGDVERVFERFTRLDEARSSDLGGTGLGLAIARDIVQRHGGTITVGPGRVGGARFEVRFPREGSDQALTAGT